VATSGAFIILLFYRLLAGYFFIEGEGHVYRRRRRRPLSRAHEHTHATAYIDEL